MRSMEGSLGPAGGLLHALRLLQGKIYRNILFEGSGSVYHGEIFEVCQPCSCWSLGGSLLVSTRTGFTDDHRHIDLGVLRAACHTSCFFVGFLVQGIDEI